MSFDETIPEKPEKPVEDATYRLRWQRQTVPVKKEKVQYDLVTRLEIEKLRMQLQQKKLEVEQAIMAIKQKFEAK